MNEGLPLCLTLTNISVEYSGRFWNILKIYYVDILHMYINSSVYIYIYIHIKKG